MQPRCSSSRAEKVLAPYPVQTAAVSHTDTAALPVIKWRMRLLQTHEYQQLPCTGCHVDGYIVWNKRPGGHFWDLMVSHCFMSIYYPLKVNMNTRMPALYNSLCCMFECICGTHHFYSYSEVHVCQTRLKEFPVSGCEYWASFPAV